MKMQYFIAALAMLALPIWAAPRTVTLNVPSMNCPVCPITVKKALTRVVGVTQAQVNLDKRQATVTFDTSKTSIDALTQATEDAGYPSMLAESRE